MGKVFVFDHPLIQHKTALMRKTDTSVKEFRAGERSGNIDGI